MDDLISRKAAIEEFENMVTSVSVYGESAEARYATNARIKFIEKLNSIPSVPAVPLDKLCEWLAEHSVIIPCETCRHFSNGYCLAIGDMDKPCPNKAEDWQRAIKEWMEGQYATN
jgi:hypothetical protein